MINYLFDKHFDTERSRLNFILGLIKVSKADSDNEENEERLMNYLFNIMRLSYDSTEYVKEQWQKSTVDTLRFETLEQSKIFLLAALGLCYVDGTYQAAEKEMIHKLADSLNVDSKDVEALETLMIHQVEIMYEAKKVIG